MCVSKQQWCGIETAIKKGAIVRFGYQGSTVSVHKIQTDETHLAYFIAVNEKPLIGCLTSDHKDYQPLAAVFLRKRQVNTTARIARSIAKERGGKRWLSRKENHHYLEKDLEVTDIFFPTARTVISHFRKIEGLTLQSPMDSLTEGGYVSVRDGL